MKKFRVTSFAFILCSSVYSNLHAQAELVPNNGFESIATCPVGFSEFEGFVSTWQDPNTASPDYMNACANPFPAGVPKNGTGYQEPHGGLAYSGIYTFSGTLYREFIQVQLLSPLTAGETYSFSMYVVLHNKSNTAIDDLGAYFSVTAPTAAGTGMLAGAPSPQISNPAGSVITDTLNWTLISGTYTAAGGEQFITLGHLKDDASTTYQSVPFGTQGAYYYIDDVSLKQTEVLPITLTSFDANLISEPGMNAVQISWGTSTEINNCCYFIERSSDGINFSDIGKVEGNGSTTIAHAYLFYDHSPRPGVNYYRLRQEDFNGMSSISETVSINNNLNGSVVSVYQNGSSFTITNVSDHELNAELFSASSVKEDVFPVGQGNVEWKPANLAHGIYLLAIRDPLSGNLLLTKKLFL